MPKLKRLFRFTVVAIFEQLRFSIVAQRGSRAKLHRVLGDGTRQTLSVPIHGEIDIGTLGAIFRQACRYIPADQLRPQFLLVIH
jgi:predicted RNA binding protein YcfA (HicA-like mRNA interferase family)